METMEGNVAAGQYPVSADKADDATVSSDGNTDAATGEAGEFSILEDSSDDEELAEELAEELEIAPLHLHTLRVPARLRGNSTPVGIRSRSRSRSRSRPSSRDVSPSPHGKTGSKGSDAIPSLVPGSSSASVGANSSASSVATDIDPDILLDRAGFEELEPPPPHEISMGPLASPIMIPGHGSFVLPSVNERMSEESLDDCHAFSDVVAALHSSLRSLNHDKDAAGEEGLLETLGEVEEEDAEQDSDDESSSNSADDGSSTKAILEKNLQQVEKAIVEVET